MKPNDRKELLKAILQGNTEIVKRLIDGNNLYFNNIDTYYKNDLKNEISKELFELEFRPGFDTLFEFEDQLKQRKALLDFGLSENEVNQYFLKQTTNKDTMNEILTLKNRLENEK